MNAAEFLEEISSDLFVHPDAPDGGVGIEDATEISPAGNDKEYERIITLDNGQRFRLLAEEVPA